MPRFHFHLIIDTYREHVGSVDLPHAGAVVSAGVKLTARLLAGAARQDAQGESWRVQATDDAGAVVYSFNISPSARGDGTSGYVH